jgi:hypothetical protein
MQVMSASSATDRARERPEESGVSCKYCAIAASHRRRLNGNSDPRAPSLGRQSPSASHSARRAVSLERAPPPLAFRADRR